jgi:hypothetical protein
VLAKRGEHRLKRPRLVRKGTKCCSRPVPGDRVQMDVCKIAPVLYQYTAIDDCSRWKVVGLYPRRSATSTLSCLVTFTLPDGHPVISGPEIVGRRP